MTRIDADNTESTVSLHVFAMHTDLLYGCFNFHRKYFNRDGQYVPFLHTGQAATAPCPPQGP